MADPSAAVVAGLLLITHLTLLLGMAAPVWLSNALDSTSVGSRNSNGGSSGGGQPPLWLAAYAGIMILGEAMGVGLVKAATTVLPVVLPTRLPVRLAALTACALTRVWTPPLLQALVTLPPLQWAPSWAATPSAAAAAKQWRARQRRRQLHWRPGGCWLRQRRASAC
jgi:hypothetical protein